MSHVALRVARARAQEPGHSIRAAVAAVRARCEPPLLCDAGGGKRDTVGFNGMVREQALLQGRARAVDSPGWWH